MSARRFRERYSPAMCQAVQAHLQALSVDELQSLLVSFELRRGPGLVLLRLELRRRPVARLPTYP